jgi:hypothetical protein
VKKPLDEGSPVAQHRNCKFSFALRENVRQRDARIDGAIVPTKNLIRPENTRIEAMLSEVDVALHLGL